MKEETNEVNDNVQYTKKQKKKKLQPATMSIFDNLYVDNSGFVNSKRQRRLVKLARKGIYTCTDKFDSTTKDGIMESTIVADPKLQDADLIQLICLKIQEAITTRNIVDKVVKIKKRRATVTVTTLHGYNITINLVKRIICKTDFLLGCTLSSIFSALASLCQIDGEYKYHVNNINSPCVNLTLNHNINK